MSIEKILEENYPEWKLLSKKELFSGKGIAVEVENVIDGRKKCCFSDGEKINDLDNLKVKDLKNILEKFDENMEVWFIDNEGNEFPLGPGLEHGGVKEGKLPEYYFLLKDQSYLMGPTYPVVYLGCTG